MSLDNLTTKHASLPIPPGPLPHVLQLHQLSGGKVLVGASSSNCRLHCRRDKWHLGEQWGTKCWEGSPPGGGAEESKPWWVPEAALLVKAAPRDRPFTFSETPRQKGGPQAVRSTGTRRRGPGAIGLHAGFLLALPLLRGNPVASSVTASRCAGMGSQSSVDGGEHP